jgi:hypothetical protein
MNAAPRPKASTETNGRADERTLSSLRTAATNQDQGLSRAS